MKDVLGKEIEQGDLIADVRTDSYGWKQPGIVHGGVTNGGSVRYYSTVSKKRTYTKAKCIVKIDLETLNRLHQEKIDELEEFRERNASNWASRLIDEAKYAYDNVLKLYEEYRNE